MIKTTVDLHIARKITHNVGVLCMFFCHYFLSERTSWLILVIVGGSLLVLDFTRQKSERLRQFTPKVLGGIMRRNEINNYAGTSYLFLGVTIIFILFPRNIVSMSLLFLAFADPIASFFGILVGSIKLIGKKTLEGSLAAMIICSIVSYIYLFLNEIMVDHILVASLAGGIIAALSELIPLGKLDDNFSQPILSACMLSILFYLFGGALS